MQLLISDANILIDLEEGELLSSLFSLPYQFTVPDILYFDELETQHAHLLDMGLVLGELSAQTMLYAMELVGRVRGPSRNDCFALALARQQNCPLLSGDEALRKAARHEAVDVKGTLWVVEELVRTGKISVDRAHAAYERMRSNARRLPWAIAHQRLDDLTR
ncbi:PIN domain-containing protein [Enterobacterales bacterium BD_CKDN230030183-1A_HGKHYDSX7]